MDEQHSSYLAYRHLAGKGLVTAAAALLFATGLVVFLSRIDYTEFSEPGAAVWAIVPLLVGRTGVYVLSWFNCRSFLKSLFTVIMVVILGIPLGFGILAPVTQWFLTRLLHGSSIALSASLAAGWFIILPVLIVELMTGEVVARKRWARLISGAVLSFLLILFVEFATETLGHAHNIDGVRMLLYAPLSWLVVVLLVDAPAGAVYEHEGL